MSIIMIRNAADISLLRPFLTSKAVYLKVFSYTKRGTKGIFLLRRRVEKLSLDTCPMLFREGSDWRCRLLLPDREDIITVKPHHQQPEPSARDGRIFHRISSSL